MPLIRSESKFTAVLPKGLERVLSLPEDARVLDVGGWTAPLNRADWMIDAMPYDTRGATHPAGVGPGPERFSRERWVQRDLCAKEPYPFEDDFFDFAVCTFTLEDLRDPVWVCQEMSRIAKAGYVEVPSLLDELTWGVREPSGGPWLGHDHHLWLCTIDDSELVFLKKLHSLHPNRRVRVPPRRALRLRWEERVLARFWEGELRARERLTIDTYPLDELERALGERFSQTGVERAALELRERALRARRRFVSVFRRAAGAWWRRRERSRPAA